MERLPADIIYTLQQDPKVYDALIRCHSRFRDIGRERNLRELCELPISASEIAKWDLLHPHMELTLHKYYATSIKQFREISASLIYPIDEVPEESELYNKDAFKLHFSMNIEDNQGSTMAIDYFPWLSPEEQKRYQERFYEYPTGMVTAMQDLLEDGFIIILPVILYQIYRSRISCVKRDPDYPLKMVRRDYRSVIQHLLSLTDGKPLKFRKDILISYIAPNVGDLENTLDDLHRFIEKGEWVLKEFLPKIVN
jgi:hypothetical protein